MTHTPLSRYWYSIGESMENRPELPTYLRQWIPFNSNVHADVERLVQYATERLAVEAESIGTFDLCRHDDLAPITKHGTAEVLATITVETLGKGK